jgi:hypothetical protein
MKLSINLVITPYPLAHDIGGSALMATAADIPPPSIS